VRTPTSGSTWIQVALGSPPPRGIGGGTDICTACDDLTPIEREQPSTVNTPRQQEVGVSTTWVSNSAVRRPSPGCSIRPGSWRLVPQ